MAKKKTRKSRKRVIPSSGYEMKVERIGDRVIFKLIVNPGRTNEAHLQVLTQNDRTALVQKVFRTLGDLWPAFDFRVSADGRSIVDINP